VVILVIFAIDIWTKRMAFSKVDAFSIKMGDVYNYIQITSFFNELKVINIGVIFGMFRSINYDKSFYQP
jgi:lipoprotein signal peptidase